MRAEKRNVLIHCHAGVSRSASVLCAYLMRKYGWSSQRALSYLTERRSRIKPNENFLRILKDYEYQCNGKT
jgi:protein-tyrosine phosphatase